MKQIFSRLQSGQPVSSETRSVFRNFFFLSVVQATNFIIPLIILPYLLVVVGVENFGLISLAQSVMSYFIIITDFGFNLTSTREIVSNRHDLKKVSEIVSTTLVLKTMLSFACFVVLLLCLRFVPMLADHSLFYLISFSLVIGQLVMPTWFFQGMEKMQFLAYINVVGKTVFTVLIFFLVVKPGDYMYVPLYLSLGNILSGILGIAIMFRRFKLNFRMPSVQVLKKELKTGGSIMLSNFAINAYVNSNIVILGFFSNTTVVGYYSVAEKILYCVRQIMNLFFQATYPQLCKVAQISHQKVLLFFRNFLVPFTIFITV
ncbi:MAG: flippase, partial [Chitinophagaceae bacterium]